MEREVMYMSYLGPIVKKRKDKVDGTGEKGYAPAGNRTRAARVAGEHSTTEPPALMRVAASTGYLKGEWTEN